MVMHLRCITTFHFCPTTATPPFHSSSMHVPSVQDNSLRNASGIFFAPPRFTGFCILFAPQMFVVFATPLVKKMHVKSGAPPHAALHALPRFRFALLAKVPSFATRDEPYRFTCIEDACETLGHTHVLLIFASLIHPSERSGCTSETVFSDWVVVSVVLCNTPQFWKRLEKKSEAVCNTSGVTCGAVLVWG